MVQAWILNGSPDSQRHREAFSIHRPISVRRKPTSGKQTGWGWKGARALFAVLAFLLLLGGFSMLRAFGTDTRPPAASAVERTVYVDAGDTLWSIAASVKKDGLDVREAVRRIQKRNELNASELHIGQQLIIPASVLP
jgi:hypothetical protein